MTPWPFLCLTYRMANTRQWWSDTFNDEAKDQAAFAEAEENANATAFEQDFELYADEWYEIWALAYAYLTGE